MVDSPFDALKNNVRTVRKTGSTVDLSRISYNTHLELAVRLVTGAPSVNHFAAQMDTYPLRYIPDMGQIIDRLRANEHLLEPGDSVDEPPEYERYDRWQCLAAIWLSGRFGESDTYQASSPLHDLLCHSADLDGLRIPRMISEGKLTTTVAESAAQQPNESFILSAWLFEKEGLSIEHWDRLRHSAEKFGYGKQAAAHFCSACRESVNHRWDPRSAIALGVYDLPVSTPSFFRDGESDKEFRYRINRIWRWEEPEVFE